ncbi:Sensor histidine kinase WalK (WalK) [Fructobacillus fructosus]|uniref:histidine kinase n=2 Tax=Fructobacillus fructosus TaxID=1631 RepID=A0ABN9YW69_9LACO|nr:HAMP domain-containing histidine kinase [Fructobacillus fructosus]MBD9366942.1 HAMP domain-containing histidine kinase [Leuconostoc mesenteroides]MCH9869295.1 HAMP domain-containing histidine kinase [Serratia marcescens]CAK1233292.1 Sensor histidine kinase WalK (WalK) [Fructobacillus fructosus]CAK1245665.1 Sensor histidine kinase WalK (WalK) [Fructobacillus fructosus]
MAKKVTIICQAFVKITLAFAFIFAAAWLIFFDLLKERPSWSNWTSWPSFCLFVLFFSLIAFIFIIGQTRQKSRMMLLSESLKSKVTTKLQLDCPEKLHGSPEKQLDELFDFVIERYNHERLEQRQMAASKEEMMTNISHDLRTPLTAIIGYLGLVVTPTTVMREGDQQKYLETAYHKANQMKMLVEDLFEFAKLQSSQITLNVTDFSLGDLFEQVLANYAVEAEKRGIRLTTQLAPDFIVMAGDSEKLARVLINLVENALKYGQDASFIKITGQEKANNQVEIRVVNDGPAIPQEALTQLFNRFYRVESSRNTGTGGTGLGLSIVKGVIDKHHGSVRAESSEELTSFIITLPKKQEKEE